MARSRRRCGVSPQPAFNFIPLQLHPALTFAFPLWARPSQCRRDVPSGGEMPRFEFIMIMRRAEVRLTTLKRPAFLLRLPLFFLYFVLCAFILAPFPFAFLVLFLFLSLSRPLIQDVSFLSVLWMYRLSTEEFPSSHYIPFSSAILLSNHRFVSIHSLFVHSESSVLIAEIK